ncbi:g5792 [Coccomyxa viridis]|uniref:G5792 protein n=1 Tax=Coccomyxa viridis TaxID=1274662 RepID=A0ABP1FV23_9CHLO
MIEAEVSAPDSAKPSSAEVARTIVDLMTHGALATAGADQVPLGTYASYVLDTQGQPILRLRKEAVHTANLLRNPQCSLFIQPDDMPARILARATLIGKVEKVEGEDAEVAAQRHAELHFGGVGVDAPQPTDQYYKLLVERCFYVGGMGSKCQAEVITAAEYMAADADPLRDCAAAIVEYQNKERTEDVLRIAAFALGVPLERLEGAQLLWLDRLGIYLFAATVGGPGAQVVRVTFAREVTDERDAQSTLTMLAQVAWEKERNYIPIMSTVPDPVAS